jgi:ubiquinone/menaquinone biosynthesis C-methylase UbiE
MAMTRFEKLFVNRERKGQRNIEKVRTRLEQLPIENLHDALELGCGIGSVSAFIAENYQMSVIGTDFDPAQIEIAKSTYPEKKGLRYGIENASKLGFEDGGFDLVVSQNVFHHVPNWKEAVREVSRVIKPGGYFLWLDLTFPKTMVKIFQPFVKNYGLYTFEAIMAQFVENRFEELNHERSLFAHNLVFQKRVN